MKSLLRGLPVRGRRRPQSGVGERWTSLVTDAETTWTEARANAAGQRILMGTSLGAYSHGVILESALAAALTQRGAQVSVLLCDSALPACQLSKIAKVAPVDLVNGKQTRICRTCEPSGVSVYRPLELPVLNYSSYLTEGDRAQASLIADEVPASQMAKFQYEGLAVGEHAFAGALRYYARGDLTGETHGAQVAARYLEASMLSTFALRRLVGELEPDVAVFHHGIYVPQGLLGEVCRAEGVRVVNSNPGYRDQTYVFSHGDSYHHTMISENTQSWRSMPWDRDRSDSILDYLSERRRGSGDWIHFNPESDERIDHIREEIGLGFDRPTFGLLTNVLWDAQLHYESNAFSSMLEWVRFTIDWFSLRPDLDLVIRVHPAEVSGAVPSRQRLVDEIDQMFPELPNNVRVVPPESKLSTYAIMDQCVAALIYNTKTGIELAAQGQPVVVAGEAWIRDKGFSLDARDPAQYAELLGSIRPGERLSDEQLELARRYAFHYFFRRMVPLPFISSPRRFEAQLDLANLDDLQPGRDPGLDVVCDGILEGAPFIYPVELLGG